MKRGEGKRNRWAAFVCTFVRWLAGSSLGRHDDVGLVHPRTGEWHTRPAGAASVVSR